MRLPCGDWSAIEALIEHHLIAAGVTVTVYEYE